MSGPSARFIGLMRLITILLLTTSAFAGTLEDSARPVREGVPSWNQNAVQFQFAPAFAFKEVAGAKSYRFTLTTSSGEKLSFEAARPDAALSPVWTKVPVGKTTLVVEALGADGGVIGAAMTRPFHRAAVFEPREAGAQPAWNESARTALDALVHSPDLLCWFTTG